MAKMPKPKMPIAKPGAPAPASMKGPAKAMAKPTMAKALRKKGK